MQHVVVATLVRSSRFLCLIATLGVLVPRSVVFFVETGRLCVQNYPSQRSRNPTLALVNIDRSHRVNDDERTVLSLRSRHYASNRTGRRPLPWRMATDGCVTSTIAPNPSSLLNSENGRSSSSLGSVFGPQFSSFIENAGHS